MKNKLKRFFLKKVNKSPNNPFLDKYMKQFSPKYWNQKNRWKKTELWFNNKNFNIKNRNYSLKESTNIFFSLLNTIKWQITIAIILVFGFYYFEQILIQNGFSQLILNNMPFLNQIRITDANYTDILTTLAQISGIFLGLYFTAISVVISTAYGNVPENIRSLLINEKIGDIYIEIVALLGAVSILLLLLNILGFTISILNLILVSALGLMSIFSFLVLGKRTFYFFDPSSLIKHLTSKLARLIESVTIDGFKWNDQNFQAHYQKEAEKSIKTILDIVEIASKKEHLQGKALNELAFHALILLRYYIGIKHQIPTESRWFKPKGQYPNWLAMEANSDSQITTAVQTKTSIAPKIIPDYVWFENEIKKILIYSFNAHLGRIDLNNALILAEYVNETFKNLGKELAVFESISLFQLLGKIINELPKFNENSYEILKNEKEQYLLTIGLVDIYFVFFLNILLGIHETLEKTNAKSFSDNIEKINWNKKETLYKYNLPREVIKQLEFLQKRLEFEYNIENQLITPLWYQNQISALGFSRFISSSLDCLILELEKLFITNLEVLLSDKQYIFSIPYILRGLEACEKFQIDKIKEFYEEISTLRKVEDIPWPNITWDEFEKRINDLKNQLLVKLGLLIPEIANIPPLDDLPDYFGQSYFYIAQECYNSLTNQNRKLFEKLFPSFFNACLLAHDRLLNSETDFNDSDMEILRMEIIINLIEMSSYAIIYSELENIDYWKLTKKIWDSYIKNLDDPKPFIELLNELSDYHPLKITHQNLIRSKYEQQLLSKLHEYLGEFGYYIPGIEDQPDHKSSIIRTLTKSSFISSEDIRAVFIVKYLIENPEFNELKLKAPTKEFYEELKKEKSKNESFVEFIRDSLK